MTEELQNSLKMSNSKELTHNSKLLSNETLLERGDEKRSDDAKGATICPPLYLSALSSSDDEEYNEKTKKQIPKAEKNGTLTTSGAKRRSRGSKCASEPDETDAKIGSFMEGQRYRKIQAVIQARRQLDSTDTSSESEDEETVTRKLDEAKEIRANMERLNKCIIDNGSITKTQKYWKRFGKKLSNKLQPHYLSISSSSDEEDRNAPVEQKSETENNTKQDNKQEETKTCTNEHQNNANETGDIE